jgi:hypothetical protein
MYNRPDIGRLEAANNRSQRYAATFCRLNSMASQKGALITRADRPRKSKRVPDGEPFPAGP